MTMAHRDRGRGHIGGRTLAVEKPGNPMRRVFPPLDSRAMPSHTRRATSFAYLVQFWNDTPMSKSGFHGAI